MITEGRDFTAAQPTPRACRREHGSTNVPPELSFVDDGRRRNGQTSCVHTRRRRTCKQCSSSRVAQGARRSTRLPEQWRNVTIDHPTVPNVTPHVTMIGCAPRESTGTYRPCRTIPTRKSRRVKVRVLGRVFDELEARSVPRVRMDVVPMDVRHRAPTAARRDRRGMHGRHPGHADGRPAPLP